MPDTEYFTRKIFKIFPNGFCLWEIQVFIFFPFPFSSTLLMSELSHDLILPEQRGLQNKKVDRVGNIC